MENSKKLILMRHGKADFAASDFLRPLTEYGREQVRHQGKNLVNIVGVVDLAIVSAAVRASQTCDELRRGGLQIAKLQFEQELYDENYADTVLKLIHEVEPQVQTLLVIFHQPALAELSLKLSLASSDSQAVIDARQAPASFVWGTVDGDWAELESWKLGGIVEPID
ncbi:SixA phosphatase family protein [Mobiluncus mulieris]|uniref:SixA phosphatase family protein n=1 Tax=Mobiluncus mulieris TaxID=2052 RepID=UPI00019F9608|nr:histidine phosphatase family protein [Mobiluncus mulieris]EEJ53952.1 putative phosphohistidine phosphatase SixA [Mobiluncus mulieris ATCC 35243]MCU9976460.1 phosphohistidine phosphatase [Mobiluncus mulieris]MCV0003249.1 phosphohistidine phosphatase [Mobiluncus mulieris]NMW75729.1 phosphohistidine phosphatase [Mobiluncus mulieris]